MTIKNTKVSSEVSHLLNANFKNINYKLQITNYKYQLRNKYE